MGKGGGKRGEREGEGEGEREEDGRRLAAMFVFVTSLQHQ